VRPALALLLTLGLAACTAEPDSAPAPVGQEAARDAELAALKAELRADLPDVPTIAVDELAARLDAGETPLLIDVRAADEYAVSHLRGARRAETPAEAEALLEGVPNDREVIVYCSVGWRSGHLAQALRREGRTNVRNLEGSIFEWANTGHPVWRGDEPVRAVHPYDAEWGRLLDRSLWAGLE